MKNQYFGDINDYRKYGLLRSIIRATGFRVLVAWMLTPDDNSTDGNFTSYLRKPKEYSQYDRILFDGLNGLLSRHQKRDVSLIEDTDLLPGAGYFSDMTPDLGPARVAWFSGLVESASDFDLVFLDPDNGLEVKSRPYGRKWSSKFLYWREVETLWASGKSLLIYQHFVREKRPHFIQRMLTALQMATPGSHVVAFSTPNVAFLMALQVQPRHFNQAIVGAVQENWEGQIQHWDFTVTE